MSYQQQIGPQEAALKKLTDEYAQKPNDDLRRQIIRESDVLRHLVTAAKGQPMERARRAAIIAKKIVVKKAIA